MLRALGLLLTLIVIVGVVYALAGPSEIEKSSETKVDRAGKASSVTGEASLEPARTTAIESTTKQKMSCPKKRNRAVLVGRFERPESVPRYEILQEKRNEHDRACGARLLIDTKARSEANLTLITRDVKARYRKLDAVSIEFTDTSVAFSYNGGVLIFNTPAGAIYMGYIYGPPNNRGYYAKAAD